MSKRWVVRQFELENNSITKTTVEHLIQNGISVVINWEEQKLTFSIYECVSIKQYFDIICLKLYSKE